MGHEEPGGGAVGPALRVQVTAEGVRVGLHPGSLDDEALTELLESPEAGSLVGDPESNAREGVEAPHEASRTDVSGDGLLVALSWSPAEAVGKGRDLRASLLDAVRDVVPLLVKAEDLVGRNLPLPPPGQRAWLVRGRVDDADRTGVWLQEGYIAVGWADAPEVVAGLGRDRFKEQVATGYPQFTPAQVRSAAGNLVRFLDDIAEGDLVVTPTGDDLRIGTVTSSPYRKDGARDLHRRDVRCQGVIPRWRSSSSLPSGLKDAMDRRHTVSDLSELREELAAVIAREAPRPLPLTLGSRRRSPLREAG